MLPYSIYKLVPFFCIVIGIMAIFMAPDQSAGEGFGALLLAIGVYIVSLRMRNK